MKRKWLEKVGEWQRNRQRNKGKKKPKCCTCPVDGLSTSCQIKAHKHLALCLQAIGLNPNSTHVNYQGGVN